MVGLAKPRPTLRSADQRRISILGAKLTRPPRLHDERRFDDGEHRPGERAAERLEFAAGLPTDDDRRPREPRMLSQVEIRRSHSWF